MTGRIRLPPPYDFELSCRIAGYPRLCRIEVPVASGTALMELRSHGSVDHPEVVWSVPDAANAVAPHRAALAAAARRILDADADWTPFHRACASAPALAPLAESLRGLRILRLPSLHAALIETVLRQQLRPLAAAALHADWCAGRPAALPARKATALAGLRPWNDTELLAMNGEAAIEALIIQPGVGRWTAAWALWRGLAHPDALPADDAEVRAAATAFFRARSPLSVPGLQRRLRPWAGFRGCAAYYMLGAWRHRRGIQSPYQP